MADNPQDLIASELVRRELAKRRADPVGTAVKKVAGKVPPNQPMGYGESFATGMQDPLAGGRQLYTHGTGSPQEAEAVDKSIRERESGLQSRGYSGVARGLGSAAMSLPLMAAGGAGIPGAIAGGAVSGALQPTTDQNFGAAKAAQAAFGGAVGGAGAVGARALGAVIAPGTQAGARELADQGVQLTPGQASGGILRRIEEAAKSLPILGNFIRERERQSIETFNISVLNQALEPIGINLPIGTRAGHQAVGATQRALGAAYDNLMPHLRVQWDQQLAADVTMASFRANTLAEPQLRQFNTLVRQYVEPLSQRSAVPARQAQSLKEIDGALRSRADSYRSSDNPDHRNLAEAINEVRDALHGAMTRQNPPQMVQALGRIDTGWAMFTRAQQASSRRATSEGVFTANDLLQTIKSQDKSVRKGQFARGDALMQVYAEAGQRVLPGKMPDSGTTERLRMFDLVSGAAGALGSPLYTQRATRAAAAYMNPGIVRRGTRNLLRQGSAPLSIGGVPALMDSAPSRVPSEQ